MTSIFLDFSGSTGNSANYWCTVNDIYDNNKHRIDKFFIWDSETAQISQSEFERVLKERKGYGGTDPTKVAYAIYKNKIKSVILITDGQVSDSSVMSCDNIFTNSGYKIDEIDCYIINTSPYNNDINLSVTCPFTRSGNSRVYYKKSMISPIETQIKFNDNDFELLEKLNEINLDNFYDKFNLLEDLIIAKNMGTTENIPLKNKIVVMKNRLVKELSEKMSNNSNSNLTNLLENNKLEEALNIATEMTNAYYGNTLTSYLENKINKLISYCGNLQGVYNVGQIKSNRIAIAPTVQKTDINPEIETLNLTQHPIECPVIYDEDVPQILINAGEPILMNIEKHIVDDITSCPLRILNYPEVKEKFRSRISKFIGVKYSEYLEKNPFTKSEIEGTIPLGCHDEHMKVGNYTIAKMMTDGKLMGNPNLYYAVIWYLVRQNQIEYLKEIENNLNEHMIYRLKNTKTMASLSGLPQFVNTKVSSDVAVWYVVNSGYFNQPTDRDSLRNHIFNIEPLIEILKLLNYPIEEKALNYIHRTKTMMQMLGMVKKMNTNEKIDFKFRINGLYQNGIFINTKNISNKMKENEKIVSFVPIDGPASEEQIEKIMITLPQLFRNLSISEIVGLYNMIDANKSASDIRINYQEKYPKPEHRIDWEYGLKEKEYKTIKICPLTLRPFYQINKEETWKDYIKNEVGIHPENSLKGNRYYATSMFKYGKKPNVDEFLIFLFNRYIICNDKYQTLPYQVKHMYYKINEGYYFLDEITEELEIKYYKSMIIKNRIELENKYFEN